MDFPQRGRGGTPPLLPILFRRNNVPLLVVPLGGKNCQSLFETLPYPHPYPPSIRELAWQPLQDFCSDQQFSGEPEALLAPRLCHRISFRSLSIATASSHISCASSTFKLSELLCPKDIIEDNIKRYVWMCEHNAMIEHCSGHFHTIQNSSIYPDRSV